jgi:hypothetical protein
MANHFEVILFYHRTQMLPSPLILALLETFSSKTKTFFQLSEEAEACFPNSFAPHH